MKRIAWIAIGVVVLAGVGLGALYYMRQGQVDAQLEAVKARLAERGWTVTWAAKEVDGTPFLSDRVRLAGTALVSEGGVLVKLGDITITEDEASPGALAASFPPETTVEIPVGGLAREQMPILPERLTIAVASEAMRLVLRDTGDAEPMMVLFADRLRATVDQEDFPITVAVDAASLEGASEPAPGSRKLRLKSNDFALDLRDASGPAPTIVDSRYTELQIGATIEAGDFAEFQEKFRALAENLIQGAFQSSGQTIVVSSMGGGGQPQTLTWKAGPQTGIFGIDQGTFTYDSEDRDIEVAVEVPEVSGAFDATALFYQRRIKLPLVGPGSSPRDGALRIAVEDFMPGETLWKSFDPTGRFEREPADLLLDATSSMRLAGGQGRAVPVELSNVSLNELKVAALGATVDASGDVEILQPINLPLGRIDVSLTGAGALIDKLRGIGVLDEGLADQADAILQVYARAAEDADRHQTEIAFTNDGLLINGLSTDGPPPPSDPGEDLLRPGGGGR